MDLERPMKTPSTIYITSKHLDLCNREIGDGRFETLSSVVSYAMRFCLDHLQKERPEDLKHIVREDTRPVRMRMDNYVVSSLADLGLFSRAEAPDYSLDFYFRWKGLE